jgi:hypothetical protein
MWETLLAMFQIDGTIIYPPFAGSELERYERELGRLLPQSYKSYCRTFGPGDIVSPFQYSISAPGPVGWDSLLEARRMNGYARETYYDLLQRIGEESDASILSTALFFGTDLGTYFYFWNLADTTSASDNEYAVYVIRRDDSIVRLCDTFYDFVVKICLSNGVPGEDPSVERERTFTPAGNFPTAS